MCALPRKRPSCCVAAKMTRCAKSVITRCSRNPWLTGGFCGQAHREYRALARLARHGHVAAHHARELAREGEAEPRAAEALRRGGIRLAELLEQLCLLLSGHTNAGVSDRELDPLATVGDPARPQRDLAVLGELAGVAQ